MGTKEQRIWEQLKKGSEQILEQAKDDILVQEEVIKLAEKNILKEVEKFKKIK